MNSIFSKTLIGYHKSALKSIVLGEFFLNYLRIIIIIVLHS